MQNMIKTNKLLKTLETTPETKLVYESTYKKLETKKIETGSHSFRFRAPRDEWGGVLSTHL